MRDAIIPTRSLFMYPGYRRVWVLAAITVDTWSQSAWRSPGCRATYLHGRGKDTGLHIQVAHHIDKFLPAVCKGEGNAPSLLTPIRWIG